MLCNFDITFDIKNISEIRKFPQVPVRYYDTTVTFLYMEAAGKIIFLHFLHKLTHFTLFRIRESTIKYTVPREVSHFQ
jgi:hypothetical protein